MGKKRPAPHIRKKRKKLAQARREILKANLAHEIDATRSTDTQTFYSVLHRVRTNKVSRNH